MIKNSNDTIDPLRVVPQVQGFRFYRAIGHSVDVTSCSLEELADALQKVCCEAVIFHFERGDFQNWIRDTIGDNELARRIDEMKACSRQLSQECCRKDLVEIINVRILQLEVAKSPSVFEKAQKEKSYANTLRDKGVLRVGGSRIRGKLL